jgi:surface protein
MSGMFSECFSLKELNISNFDKRKTIFMTGIFAGFSFLKFLDILNFNTNNVKNMRYMFYEFL